LFQIIKALLGLFIVLDLMILSVKAEEITLAATEWCPYSCSTLKEGGLVGSKVKRILKSHGINLKVIFLPWKRAVQLVNDGQIDGLLTAVKEEVPQMRLTKFPAETYRSCLFGLKNDKRVITKDMISSLEIAIIDGYSYGPLFDKLIQDRLGHFTRLGGQNILKRMYKMMKLNRVDYILEDERVALHLYPNKLSQKICAAKRPFYVAISPRYHEVEKVLSILNNGFR